MCASRSLRVGFTLIGYVLSGAGNRAKKHHEESDGDSLVERESNNCHSSKEVTHV
jgi:hypothetical protein